jgi:predicted pyridoxine 5'-phosphate oxidase superfamily flavin-nucleotide-binding protein
LVQQQTSYVHDKESLPYGQQLARTRWDTHASGEAFDQKKKPYLTEQARDFISQQSFCVLAGLDAHGQLVGQLAMEHVGFVQTLDESACLIRLSNSLESSRLIQQLWLQSQSSSGQPAQLGLFFIHHPTRERLCVHGKAHILQFVSAPCFSADRQSASIWVLLRVEQAFFHCTRYVRTRIPGLTSSAIAAQDHLWQREQLANCDQRRLSQEICGFIERQFLCYLCTVDREGRCAINHRGGAPGFLIALPPSETAPGGMILLPDYAGNGAFEAIGNIFETAQASIIIPDFTTQVALQIFGAAQVFDLDEIPIELAQKCNGAERVIAIFVLHIEGQGGNWAASLLYEQKRAALKGATDKSLESCPLSE